MRKGPKNPGERNRDRDSDEKNRRMRHKSRGARRNVTDDVYEEEGEEDASDAEEEFDPYYDGLSFTTERFDASTQGDLTTRTTSVANERAILVGVYAPGQGLGDDPLAELAGLAEAANVDPVGSLIQRRAYPDVAYCLGSGKLDELEALVMATQAEVVL
ncbi:MAG: hypothetical protein II150_05340, partial [Thermoguttaceae bacterium]|nr:hypothetical protein [Thermoguttaceae bacterium]